MNPADTQDIYSVSQLTREIKCLLEDGFPSLWVEGEISNFKRHSSGHLYFSLKDADAQLSCVMWRGKNSNLLFRPEDGMKILANGRITLYARQGKYQLDVDRLRPVGVGELQYAFEQLKNRLEAEGLFLSEYKKSLPAFPERIGVVTSSTGAAIRDIYSVIGRRFPAVDLVLCPVRVQGPGAAEEITEAIESLNLQNAVDVMIVGRGGGSMEDLWPFNEEMVARAVFESDIPVISAVGHEIDFTICDFVADLRAPTPSAAAEVVVRDRDDLIQTLEFWKDQISSILSTRIDGYRDRLTGFTKHYGLRKPFDQIREYRFQLDDLNRMLESSMQQKLKDSAHKIVQLQSKLSALNPDDVLKRGYSVTTRIADRTVVKDASSLQKDEEVNIQFYQGKVRSKVTNVVSK